MSERMTSVRLGDCTGWANYGDQTRAEMIEQYKRKAARDKAEAEAILAANDEDFVVEQYTGAHVRRNLVRLEP